MTEQERQVEEYLAWLLEEGVIELIGVDANGQPVYQKTGKPMPEVGLE